MKKLIIVFVIIAIALVLFVPIPQGSYDDGGTRVYSALTYKIVVWNKIMAEADDNGKTVHHSIYHKTSVFWFPDNQKKIGELWQIEKENAGLDSSLQLNENTEASEVFADTSLLNCYTSQHYTADAPGYRNPDLKISQKQAEFIIGVWDECLWENDVTKTEYDYVFRGENIEVRYCYDEGIFNDVINNRHIILSDEIREQVNEAVDKFVVLPIVD